MQTYRDIRRLAMLLVHHESTRGFSDPGAIALSEWYEQFCATQGAHADKPLDLSTKQLKCLPDLIKLPLSLGIPCIRLDNNPELEDLDPLHQMPLITRLWTIEQALKVEQSPPLIRVLNEIMEALLNSKTTLELSLKDLDTVPVYLQLLSHLKELKLRYGNKITNLSNLRHFTSLNRLVLIDFYELLNLKRLRDLPDLKVLEIQDASSRRLLEGIENIPTLEKISLLGIGIENIDALKKIPHLDEIEISSGYYLQHLNGINNFPSLNKLRVIHTERLETISIDAPNSSLKIIKIYGAISLQIITGIDQLYNLKTLAIYGARNLNTLGGIETISVLEKFEVETTDINFLKRARENQLLPGRLLLFKINDNGPLISIGLFKYDFRESGPI